MRQCLLVLCVFIAIAVLILAYKGKCNQAYSPLSEGFGGHGGGGGGHGGGGHGGGGFHGGDGHGAFHGLHGGGGRGGRGRGRGRGSGYNDGDGVWDSGAVWWWPSWWYDPMYYYADIDDVVSPNNQCDLGCLNAYKSCIDQKKGKDTCVGILEGCLSNCG